MSGGPVPPKQSRRPEDKGTRADAGHPRRRRALPGDEVEHRIVAEERVHSHSTGDEDEVERGPLVERAVGPEREAELAPDRPRPRADEDDPSARRPGKHLVRPGQIQLGEVGEDEKPGGERASGGHAPSLTGTGAPGEATTVNCENCDGRPRIAQPDGCMKVSNTSASPRPRV